MSRHSEQKADGRASPAYRLHGITLRSDLPLPHLQPAAAPGGDAPAPTPDLRLLLADPARREPRPPEVPVRSPDGGRASSRAAVSPSAGDRESPPFIPELQQATPLYESEQCTPDGLPDTRLLRLADRHILSFPETADFHLGPEKIVCRLRNPTDLALAEILVLGPVMSVWLELRGIRTLHASAVSVNGRAVAFLAGNRGGKTTLAAAMMRAGHPLLTDDLLAIEAQGSEFVARPGAPLMRLWPDQAEEFPGGRDGLDRVHPAVPKLWAPVGPEGIGGFGAAPPPMTRLYLPYRHDGEAGADVRISTVRPRDAVMELVRNSFSRHSVQALGLAPERLDFFARLVERVAVRKLDYPSGFDRLPRIAAAVGADAGSGT